MERNNSFGTSWADQWDYSDPPPYSEKSSGNSNKKSGIEKTKAVASTGLKKVKEGTAHGIQWIKDRYQKTTQKR
ncbi:hypothetical protein COCNU_01G009680 [Cocos nucifera]|uniref:CDP-diacylglycerol-glycerol-3-phosphate 3-phosphatidyltransferase n=1 Tax=Cocos nucifera TaxID=13894 RepID=A0A8K0HVS6_COCNU|nr:hypothetical protein COCNU_01G009680 [Cocos nucifera]